MRPRIPLTVVLCLAVGPPAARAQAPEPSRPMAVATGLIHGASLERYQLDESVVFSYRASQYRARGPGIDLGVGVFPRYLASRLLALTLDAGLAQGTRLGTSLLFLRGGGGALVLAGQEYGGIAPALQAGVALVVPLDRRTALRLDLGQHWYFIDSEAERGWSVGIGFAVLPKRR
jgi:hypothetical protein